MKLIVDSADANFEGFSFITESNEAQDKPIVYKLKGVYAQAGVKNGNGRIYPYEVLKPEIDRYIKEMVNEGRALSELEHPSYPEVNPAEAAIRIMSLKEDNNSWIGESCILASQPKFRIRETPKGDILLGLVQYGTKMGFSTRCLGDVDDDGVVKELKMCAIDCVSNPSIGIFCETNGNRFVNGILESKDFMIDMHGDIVECAYSKLNKKLSKMPNTHISSKKADYVGKALNDFFNSLV